MTYTTLGKTNLQISRLGFGGIPIQKTDVSTVRKLIESMAEKVACEELENELRNFVVI